MFDKTIKWRHFARMFRCDSGNLGNRHGLAAPYVRLNGDTLRMVSIVIYESGLKISPTLSIIRPSAFVPWTKVSEINVYRSKTILVEEDDGDSIARLRIGDGSSMDAEDIELYVSWNLRWRRFVPTNINLIEHGEKIYDPASNKTVRVPADSVH